MTNGVEELNRLCREITGIEEARNITVEDIVNSEYWKDEKKKELIFGNYYSYWLGSRAVDCDENYANFNVRYVIGRRRGQRRLVLLRRQRERQRLCGSPRSFCKS